MCVNGFDLVGHIVCFIASGAKQSVLRNRIRSEDCFVPRNDKNYLSFVFNIEIVLLNRLVTTIMMSVIKIAYTNFAMSEL